VRKPNAPNKRVEQSIQTKQRLLDASLALFVYKGYGGTTVRDIAAKAHVSPGLMFHYFASKQEMLEEHITFMNVGIDAIAQLISQSETPLETFTFVAKAILDSFEEEKGKQLFLLSNQIATSILIPPEIKNQLHGSHTLEASRPLIAKGQHLGEIKQGDPYALALTFWGALQGIASLVAWHPKATVPEPQMVTATLKS